VTIYAGKAFWSSSSAIRLRCYCHEKAAIPELGGGFGYKQITAARTFSGEGYLFRDGFLNV
jgi:hypothetical protein